MSSRSEKWYFKTYWLVIAFLCFGPFMLPLIWFNPGISRKVKIILTVVIAVASYMFGILMLKSIRSIMDYYQFMFDQLDNMSK